MNIIVQAKCSHSKILWSRWITKHAMPTRSSSRAKRKRTFSPIVLRGTTHTHILAALHARRRRRVGTEEEIKIKQRIFTHDRVLQH